MTPKQHRDELERYVHPPEFCSVLYRKSLVDTVGSTDPLCLALAEASKYYDLESDPYVVELGERDDEKATKEMAKVLLRRETYCSRQLRLLDSRALAVEQELGSSMVSKPNIPVKVVLTQLIRRPIGMSRLALRSFSRHRKSTMPSSYRTYQRRSGRTLQPSSSPCRTSIPKQRRVLRLRLLSKLHTKLSS